MEKKSRTKKKPVQVKTTEENQVQPKNKKELICSVIKKPTKNKFLSESQKIYYDTIERKSNNNLCWSGGCW
jgi:hypothetical protein